MIPFLNEWGGVWIKYFSLVLIQNSIFLGFVFLALYLLRNASARVKYYISIIGLIKLILPPFLPAPFLQSSYTPAIIQKYSISVDQFIQIIVQALYFFHPLIWLLNNQVNKQREMACDDYSIDSKDCSSFEYSQLLAELAEKIVKSRPKFSSASAMIKQKNELLKRVQYQMKETAMKRFSKKRIFVIVTELLLLILPLSLVSSQEKKALKFGPDQKEGSDKPSMENFFPQLKPQPEGGLAAIQKVQWKPGKQRDQAVAVGVELPIEFKTERKVIK